jgi:hypothetical protein
VRYPAYPGAKREGTSQDAADDIAPRAPTLRRATLAVYQAGHEVELTADEAAAVMGQSILAIRPRVTELVRLGELEDTGRRRRNASGKFAVVWRMRWKTELFC